MHRIITFCGCRAVGKDTSANMLKYLLSTPKFLHKYWIYKLFPNLKFWGNWIKVSFAGTMKQMLSILLKVPVEMFEDRDFKENVFVDFDTLKLTHRKELDKKYVMSDSKFNRHVKEMTIDTHSYRLSIRQLLQYWGTNVMRFYFGDKLWCLTTLKYSDTNDLIISDLRFKTEAKEVKKKHGTLIYIDRPGCEVGNHQSEREAFELYQEGQCDYVIHNNGTLEDLFYKCKDIYENIT